MAWDTLNSIARRVSPSGVCGSRCSRDTGSVYQCLQRKMKHTSMSARRWQVIVIDAQRDREKEFERERERESKCTHIQTKKKTLQNLYATAVFVFLCVCGICFFFLLLEARRRT